MTTKDIKYWIPVVLWMLVIFWMSTDTFSSNNTSLIIEPLLRFIMPGLSSHEIKAIHGLIRKIGHLAEYFVLGLLIFRAFRRGSVRPLMMRWTFYTILVLVIYAATDEFHQTLVSTRTASLIDVCIDAAGGVLGQVVNALWQARFRK